MRQFKKKVGDDQADDLFKNCVELNNWGGGGAGEGGKVPQSHPFRISYDCLDTFFYSCFAMHHGWSTCERSLFFKKANLATVWFLGNFNLLFGMFDWSPVFYSGTDEWKYNLLGVSWTLPFVRAAWNTTLKLCNIPVVQKPEENELLLLGLLEKQQEYKLHVFLKKALKFTS